ncbi:hypothetical protein [Paracoccus onubensis]|uniref:Uncharacterized protein n=1 Tax=Paracoccus onubensis TaxID=1675788 RepID=A0A418T427_9RHOB|nr:hypothetical protein [Paracoccus onubensis]RJE87971.1 hypothetical protein D3P04_03355 [Paracoccus onubensis]
MAIEIEDIRRLEVRDGDTIVVQVARPVTDSIAQSIVDYFKRSVTAEVKVIVIDPDVGISVMSRPVMKEAAPSPC